MGPGVPRESPVKQVYDKEAGVTQTLIGSQRRTENIPFPSKVPAPNTSATGPMKGLEKFPPGPAQPETGQ